MAADGSGEFQVEPYSVGDLAFHITGGGLNLLAQGAAVWWLATSWSALQLSAWGLIASFILATFLADFISGFLHWAFDTWWSETTPLIHRMVIMVREHHVYPGRIFKFGVFHDAGTLSWIMLLVTLPLYAHVLRADGATAAQGYAVFTALVSTVLILFMLEFHKAGHSPRAPKWVRVLQRYGIVLSTKHHLAHHRPPHDKNYCLIHGQVDRTLGALGMWRFFEWVVNRTTGAVPARNDRQWMRRYGRMK